MRFSESHPHALAALAGTPVFADYCRLRNIPVRGNGLEAIDGLPPGIRQPVEAELDQVADLATPDGNDHLSGAAGGLPLPPPEVPAGAPLALWFLIHRSDVFREVCSHHEPREAGGWWTARARPRLKLAGLDARAARLATTVREFFFATEGTGEFATATAFRDGSMCHFEVRVSDRVRHTDGFTAAGEPTTHAVRPAIRLHFTYRTDGRARLWCTLRATDRVAELLRRFGEAALGCAVTPAPAFDLDRLKAPLSPLPDSADMEGVRVRALRLSYPASAGRRRVTLEAGAADPPGAVERLLAAHAGRGLARLRVTFAELQVRLRVNGRTKTYPVRLWPDRCDLAPTPLGERLSRCLSRWGLAT